MRNDGMYTDGCEFGYTERQWADFVLGKADSRTAAEMAAHAAACRRCAGLRAEWMRLAGGADGLTAGRVPLLPERRRKSLVRAVRMAGLRRRWLRGPALAAGAAALVLLTAGLLLKEDVITGLPASRQAAVQHASPGDYLLMREPAAEAVLAAPDTVQFRVVRAFGLAGDGYIWLSGDAREALLYLHGLPELDTVDYQAWAVRGRNADSLGLLKLGDGVAHLHVRSHLLPGAETISLSAEPKGGSDRPTSSPTALVLFDAGR